MARIDDGPLQDSRIKPWLLWDGPFTSDAQAAIFTNEFFGAAAPVDTVYEGIRTRAQVYEGIRTDAEFYVGTGQLFP
jgi:hypothetical protein